ncbi:MAG: permease-like cell division protein FtsX [Bacillota bacterium]
MKSALYNMGYFLKEARRIIGLNRLSSVFSSISTGLILFILAVIITCWSVSALLVETMQDEAEISAYLDRGIGNEQAFGLVEAIKGIGGVWDVRLVDQGEAYGRMEAILGEEARVLELFDENPFEAFIEVRIGLDELDRVAEEVGSLEGIDHIRENREVLERIQSIAAGLNSLGYIVIAAVGISTLVIVSHMIRQGIYNNRIQIDTLRLLGAPNGFIGFPFVLAGLLLTLAGGILASVLIVLLINQAYGGMAGSLPFIPLPPRGRLVSGLVILIGATSISLGVLGSLFGMSSTK